MAETEDEKHAKLQCEHEWKAVDETHMKTYIQLVCTKCGETKEIEQVPF